MFVPLSGRYRFSASVGDTIYLSPKRWRNYQTGSPNRNTRALIAHEKVHIEQYQRHGWKFGFLYLFSRAHRLYFEAEAYAAQIAVRGRDPNIIDKKAGILSSWRYMLFVPHEIAQATIEVELQRLNEGIRGVRLLK